MDWAGQAQSPRASRVLMVDSFTPRDTGEMCSRTRLQGMALSAAAGRRLWRAAYLQQQPFVARDRIGVIGWSNGGGAVLFALAQAAVGRPAGFAGPDFRAAIAFYPGSCSEQRLGADWTTVDPADDPDRRQGRLDAGRAVPGTGRSRRRAAARRSTFHAYPGAYHDFDWPNAQAPGTHRLHHARRRGADHRRGSRRPCRCDPAGARASWPHICITGARRHKNARTIDFAGGKSWQARFRD